MIAQWEKVNQQRPRVAVVTHGAEPVIVATWDPRGESTEASLELVEVPALPKESIVDTNGAGDSFVGGFLSKIVQGHDVNSAVRAGIRMSGAVVQRSGCTFPSELSFD